MVSVRKMGNNKVMTARMFRTRIDDGVALDLIFLRAQIIEDYQSVGGRPFLNPPAYQKN